MIIQRQNYIFFLRLKNKCLTNPLINQAFKKKDVFCHIKIAKRWCFYDDTIKVLSFLFWQCTQSYFLCSLSVRAKLLRLFLPLVTRLSSTDCRLFSLACSSRFASSARRVSSSFRDLTIFAASLYSGSFHISFHL